MDAPRTRSFSIRLRFDILFAALATLYIVPRSNPVQSLPWWVILLPLAAILALRVLVFYVKRVVTRREQYAAVRNKLVSDVNAQVSGR